MTEFTVASPSNDVCSLAISGDVDIASVADLLAQATSCLESPAGTFQVDLGGVTFIDSSGLGALVRLRKDAAERGKEFALVRVPSSVWRLFEVTGLAELFDPDADQ